MSSKSPKQTPAAMSKGWWSSISLEEKICFGLLLVLLALVASIRTKFNGIPFERDEGIYSYIGKLVLEGKTPYVDFYEQKFPGLFYFFGVMVFFSGDTVVGLHNGFMVLNLLTIVIVFLSARKMFSPLAGIIAATTFAFVSLTPNLSGFTIQSEHIVAFFISLGILMFVYYQKSGKRFFIALMGLAFGSAFMTKPSGIFLLGWGGFTLLLDFAFAKQRNVKELMINIVYYGAGSALIVLSLFLLVFLKGSFEQMLYWTIDMPKYYINKMKFEDGIQYFKYTRDAILQNHKFFWVHALLAIPAVLLKNVTWKFKLSILLLAGLSFLTIVPGYYFYGHYWIQLIPGLAFLSAFTFQTVTDAIKPLAKSLQPRLRIAYVLVFSFMVFSHITSQKTYYFHPNYTRILRQVYGANPFPEAMEISNYINANSKPEDNIILIGSEPQMYIYTNKKSPSRHAYFASVVTDVPPHKQWQREFVQDVEKADPRYVVFFNHAISLFVQPNTDTYVFEWANKYITDRYHLIGIADMQNGLETNYVWKEALANYRPQGQNVIYIYEKNTDVASAATATTAISAEKK